ncbi:MAG TPA: glycerophosphodiester phosphodiesterase family protein [Gammaproteobacteria bacterium]|nr:glycerophosphodiester phosphodiesterase family protein [Gammaproteobacteria bacterium]
MAETKTKNDAPTLVAHRGYPLRYPENTLIGFQAAVEAGAAWVECDVQLSRDQVPFLCHDASLKRTAGIDRPIMDLTAAELADVDVGERARFEVRFKSTRPTKLEVLALWLKALPDVRVFVEIKRQSLKHFGAALVVQRVMQAVRPVRKQCIIISFDAPCLEVAREHGAVAVGWAIKDAEPATVATAAALKPEFLFAGDTLFPTAHAALPGPWRWAVYEIQDAVYARRLAAQGAQLIETDAIAEMHNAFAANPA